MQARHSMLRNNATDPIIIGTSRRLHADFLMVISSSHVLFDGSGVLEECRGPRGKSIGIPEALPYDWQSGILLPDIDESALCFRPRAVNRLSSTFSFGGVT